MIAHPATPLSPTASAAASANASLVIRRPAAFVAGAQADGTLSVGLTCRPSAILVPAASIGVSVVVGLIVRPIAGVHSGAIAATSRVDVAPLHRAPRPIVPRHSAAATAAAATVVRPAQALIVSAATSAAVAAAPIVIRPARPRLGQPSATSIVAVGLLSRGPTIFPAEVDATNGTEPKGHYRWRATVVRRLSWHAGVSRRLA
ncbi:MAG: hypothetical protein K1X74_23010 [Pirellulales bacterium]|nr:hypothetical protein [Pirellulales bacterium]